MSDGDRRRVLVSVQYGIEFGRGVARGVIAYARSHTDWRLWRHAEVLPDEVASTQTSGVIAEWVKPEAFSAVTAAAVPIVFVGEPEVRPHASCVAVDDAAVGAMAAEHLVDLGVRRFAFVGSGSWPFVYRRLSGFNAALAARGLGPAETFIQSMYGEHQRLVFESSLAEWLRQLPLPCGVLAAFDAVGIEVVAAARRSGLKIPDQLPVVGVDDDQLACELSDIPLSSVAQPLFAIGFEAARLLHERMLDPTLPGRQVLLPPVRVVNRKSSDLIAIEDTDVAAALRLIRDHAHEEINCEWLVKRLPVARRSLERRFRQAVGRSLLEHIHHVRFQRARALLADTDLPLKVIAKQTGFRTARWLATGFHRRLNLSPSEYRRQYRAEG